MYRTEEPARRTSVCIIVENETVPFDRRVWREAHALRDAGYEVSVICPKRGKWQASRDQIDGIEIYRYWCWNGDGILGHIFEYVWSWLAQLTLALRIFTQKPFRVLHGCNPPDNIFLIGALFKLFGVKFVFDHHDLSPELYMAKFGGPRKKSLLYRLSCAAERLSFQMADFSIATNESYREIAIRRGGMDPARVAVVQTCASLQETRQAQRGLSLNGKNGLGNGNGNGNGNYPHAGTNGNGKNAHQGQKLVLYLGAIGPQDGVDLLLHSANYILRERGRQDVRFRIVGSGSALPGLKDMAKRMSFNGEFEFVGRVEHDQVHQYLAASDVCVAPDPSNSFTEQCSMIKIFEYMAHAKPIVLFDLKEGRRSAGNSALYAHGNDPKDFGDQILKLVDSQSLRQTLGECGRKRVDETFNWEAQSRKLIEAYEKVLAE